MSSMRNAVQRRNHKERAQPLERAKWGLLEKHKDYSKRAADHNNKKRKLRALQEKASERNEDEFAFGMMSASSVGGIKRAKRGTENSGGSEGVLKDSVVRLMKTQDVGYLRTVLQRTRKERERADEEVVAAGVDLSAAAKPKSKGRVVFDEDGEAVVPTHQDDDEHDDDDDLSDLLGLDDEDEDESAGKVDTENMTAKELDLHRKRRKLAALEDREQQLAEALRRVEDQRARMNGSMGGVNKNGVAFKQRQRKR
ncbi:Hypothetical protein R9X50_00343600 [Acrodontium crateriforme]|uniref:U3 small nucleolar RNA-associated protein 11 n=1 Tax=Acrodontium crateriforme TaxID=150365 RepID=A0AAQ3R485_9PEZI|nr:Hypothetical protein R9X50_00343600 [Acrodontium crateriforme]